MIIIIIIIVALDSHCNSASVAYLNFLLVKEIRVTF